MTKATDRSNLKIGIEIACFLIMLATIIFAAGAVKPAIQKNTDEIHRVDTSGCAPSQIVRQRLSTMDAIQASLQNDIIRIESANQKEHRAILDRLDVILDRMIISTDTIQ